MSRPMLALTQNFQITMTGIAVATDADHVETGVGGDITVHPDGDHGRSYQLCSIHLQTDGESIRIIGDVPPAGALETLQAATARLSMLAAEHGVRSH